MPIDWKKLDESPRILIEAKLKPVAGSRIQPTGFPDLGPAQYMAPPSTEQEKKDYPNGVPTLLVESAQSMANRLEAVCWDEATDDIAAELKGLPYINVKVTGLPGKESQTNSLLEFHRLNSPYIVQKAKDTQRSLMSDGKWFTNILRTDLGMEPVSETRKKTAKEKAQSGDAEGTGDKDLDDVPGVVNLRKLAAVCFKYDPNSLIHGVFLEKIAGRLRHPRSLSAFIEATGANRADSGGVKFDRVLPSPKAAGVDASQGYGNVPFHRTEFTAQNITAYFSVDLAQIRGYGLGTDAEQLLIALSLWKVRKFLDSNMRLRTACELEVVDSEGIQVKRPDEFAFPAAKELSPLIGKLIEKNQSRFAGVTELTWNNPKG